MLDKNKKISMKVFKMNDYDWVAASSKEEAIDFYIKETGEQEIKDLDVKECNLRKDGMYCEVTIEQAIQDLKKLSDGAKVRGRRSLKFSYGDAGLTVWLTFKEAIEKYGGPFPCIIATTEQ